MYHCAEFDGWMDGSIYLLSIYICGKHIILEVYYILDIVHKEPNFGL